MLLSISYLCAVFPGVASAPVNTDDAWGSPAPPSASSPSSDPFGDGSKKDDPWGALSNAPSDGTGKSMKKSLNAICHNPFFNFCYFPAINCPTVLPNNQTYAVCLNFCSLYLVYIYSSLLSIWLRMLTLKI